MSGRTTPSSSSTRPPSGLGLFSHSSTHPASPSPAQHAQSTSTSVQVALRIRPPPAPDASSTIPPRFQRSVVHPTNGSTTQLTVDAGPPGSKGPQRQNFSFDKVIGPEDGQSSVYESIEPLVSRFMEGYNVTVLAYGQTSSGKSYTMGTDTSSSAAHRSNASSANSSPAMSNNSSSSNNINEEERAGIIPRAVKQVFDEINRKTRSENGRWKCETKTSYVEIYNEDLIDLLAGDLSPDERTPVTIREDKAGHIIWSGLKEIRVKNGNDVMRNLEAGSAIRQTGSTAMNDQSSRSHAIFSLTLTQRKYTGQGTPSMPSSSQPHSKESSPTIPQANTFSTPTRASVRYSGIPGRVSSPTPGERASPRPHTPEDASRPGSRLIPRPSSSLGNMRAPSPAMKDEDEKGHNTNSAGDNEWTTTVSKFHFVDLAGSERLKRTSAIGERAKEGISINGGLLALGNVISALGDPAKARQTTHIPYRDSKLTRLLQDSLGGNAHTLMIACVSPVEYNLSETLNTLKYANRARNIKNRAELNEIEAGWEDVEHLQQLVTRLRSELTVLRGASGSMPSISEEDGFKSSKPASASLLSLQDQYSDLSTRYAKLTAELAKAQATSSNSSFTMSAENFAQAVEPVVEEYEKSISALESQLSLTKAALSHSEEVMRETEDKINFEAQVNETNLKIVNDLKLRLAKVTEREAVTEAYVRDLENRLKSSSEQDEASSNLISDLRKEVAKYREVESNTEKYIKELETRLAKSEEVQHMQKGQIENLERDIQRREKAYQELEGRLSLLDTTEQHKQLLQELDERDKRILNIQNELEAARLQMSALEADTRRLQESAEQDAKQKDSLHRRIESLEKQPKISVLASNEPRSVTASAQSLDISNSLTPPQTPLHENDTAVAESPDNLARKLADLEKRHAFSLKDLEALSYKYKESLRHIEELSGSQSLRYRKKSSVEEPASSPENLLETLDDVAEEGLQDFSARKSSLSPINASYNTPTRASRGSNSRRSMPLSPRGSFLGRSPVASHSASHLRSASASLSQELSLAQYLNGNLPTSAQSGIPAQQQQQQAPSGGSGSLPSPYMTLANGTSSPRATSPLLSRRESLLQGGEIFFPQQIPERSNESLQQEVKKLQETLNEREEEIRALEASISDLKHVSAESVENANGTASALGLTIHPPKAVADEALKTPAGAAPPDTFSLSPNTIEAFNAIKQSMDQANETQAADASDAQLARLNDLMLSMAKKEVAHQEKVSELEEQLSNLKKQHEELRTLSKDQVLNMSTEITALREQLSSSGAETKEWETKLAKMDADIKAKGNQVSDMLEDKDLQHQQAVETLQQEHARALQARDDAHEAAQRQLQEEHATLLRRMLEAKEELSMRKAEEHDAALQRLAREHQEAEKEKDLAHQEALKGIRDEIADDLRRKDTEHKEALNRVQLQLSASRDSDQVELVRDLNDQHEAALKARDDEHRDTVQRLKADHEEAIVSRQQEHSSTLVKVREEHEATLTRLFEDHSQALQEVRDERDSALKNLQVTHKAELGRLVEQHKGDLAKVLADLETRLAALRTEHEKEMSAVKEAHEASLTASVQQAQADAREELQGRYEAERAQNKEEIAAMSSKHAEELAAEKELSETTLVALQEQHQSLAARMRETHAAALSQLKEDHEAALRQHKDAEESATLQALAKLREEHGKAISDLQEDHAESTSSLLTAHEAALAKLAADYERRLQERAAQHESILEELKVIHKRDMDRTRTDNDQEKTTVQSLSTELSQAKQRIADMQANAEEQKELLETLQAKAANQTDLQQEIQQLQRAADYAQVTENALKTELQESLDALGTLDKALIESQDERERLMREIGDIQKKVKAASASEDLASQLALANEEKESLKAEVARLTAVLSARRPISPTAQGLGINGFGSRGSRDQETLLPMHTGNELGLEGTPAQAPYPTVRHSSVVSLVNGSHISSRPPPTPPPSMPPPPLPTEAYNTLNGSVNGHNIASSSSTISLSNKGRDSVSSVFTRDSHMDTMTSNRTMSVADTISVDPRVHQKFEEQEAALNRLTKRLEHAETELKANIDLVTTLESALNDSERNLRKSRLQMNELAKERERYQTHNESLRQQVIEGQREVDNARHALMMHEEESRKKLDAQKRAQREAQTNAEARMAEIQRLNRKSKFNCF